MAAEKRVLGDDAFPRSKFAKEEDEEEVNDEEVEDFLEDQEEQGKPNRRRSKEDKPHGRRNISKARETLEMSEGALKAQQREQERAARLRAMREAREQEPNQNLDEQGHENQVQDPSEIDGELPFEDETQIENYKLLRNNNNDEGREEEFEGDLVNDYNKPDGGSEEQPHPAPPVHSSAQSPHRANVICLSSDDGSDAENDDITVTKVTKSISAPLAQQTQMRRMPEHLRRIASNPLPQNTKPASMSSNPLLYPHHHTPSLGRNHSLSGPSSSSSSTRGPRFLPGHAATEQSYTVEDSDEEDEKSARELLESNSKKKYHLHDDARNEIVNLSRPSGEPAISVAPEIARIIKPHQIGGVRFMWENVIESLSEAEKGSEGFGCILAHSMGLGKTLQVVTFSQVVLTHTKLRTILILVPINTIHNWHSEFSKWLRPEHRPNVFMLGDVKTRELRTRYDVIREWSTRGGVLLMGYELYRQLVAEKKKKNGKTDEKKKKPTTITIDSSEDEGEDESSSSSSDHGDPTNVSTHELPKPTLQENSHPHLSDQGLEFDFEPQFSDFDFDGFPDLPSLPSLPSSSYPVVSSNPSFPSPSNAPLNQPLPVTAPSSSSYKPNSSKNGQPKATIKPSMRLTAFSEEELREEMKKMLSDPGPSIVICDEGHRIKNKDSSISEALFRLKTQRRVILSGYPLQNNLTEYWCMVNFVRPNFLGTIEEFRNMFENPIKNGQCFDSTDADVELMKKRTHVLHSLLQTFVQRVNSAAILRHELPPKTETVLLLRLSPLQKDLYLKLVASMGSHLNQNKMFRFYSLANRIWNHPDDIIEKYMSQPRALQGLTSKRSNLNYDQLVQNHANHNTSSSSSYSSSYMSPQNSLASSPLSRPMGHTAPQHAPSHNTLDQYARFMYPTKPQPPSASHSSFTHTQDGAAKAEGGPNKKNKKSASKQSFDIDDEFADDAILRESDLSWVGNSIRNWTPLNLTNGTKMLFLLEMIRLSVHLGDKMLVFSQSLSTLDLIEKFLKSVEGKMNMAWTKNETFYRIDGNTNPLERQKLINAFNDKTNSVVRLFLLSTKAGGLGINLVGATRAVIFDTSWNPCHDAQAVCRVFRYGQDRPTQIYRFVAAGTMEKTIFDRQVLKHGLSNRIVDTEMTERIVSKNDIKKLFEYEEPPIEDISIPLENQDDELISRLVLSAPLLFAKTPFQHESLFGETEETLSQDAKKKALVEYYKEKRYTENMNKRELRYSTGGSFLPSATLYSTPSSSFPSSIPVRGMGSHHQAGTGPRGGNAPKKTTPIRVPPNENYVTTNMSSLFSSIGSLPNPHARTPGQSGPPRAGPDPHATNLSNTAESFNPFAGQPTRPYYQQNGTYPYLQPPGLQVGYQHRQQHPSHNLAPPRAQPSSLAPNPAPPPPTPGGFPLPLAQPLFQRNPSKP